MATIKASHLFYDMVVYALSQCNLEKLDHYQGLFKENMSKRCYISSRSHVRLIRIQRLLEEASGYRAEIVENFSDIIKWLSDNDEEAVWFICMAVKEVQERQRVMRHQLECIYNSPDKIS